MGIPDHLVSWETCKWLKKQQLKQVTVPNWERNITKIYISPCSFNLYAELSSVAQSCLTLCNPMVSLSITSLRSLLKLMSIKSVMPPNQLILCHPLLLPSIFPSIGSFPMSQFFTSGDQTIGASASASYLPMNIQDWFPLRWTGWISLKSKGLSRAFSNTTVQKYQFFNAYICTVHHAKHKARRFTR